MSIADKRASFIGYDTKNEWAPMVVRMWRELGLDVYFSNPTREYEDICPHTEYNSLETVIDCYWSKDGEHYKKTATFARDQRRIITPSPPPGAQNDFFMNGAATAAEVLVNRLVIETPESAEYSEVHRIVGNAEEALEIFKETARWPVAKSDPFKNDTSNSAKTLLKALEGRNAHHLGDFLKKVKDALAAFDSTGYLARNEEPVVARLSDARTADDPMAIVFMSPLSHIEEYSIYHSLTITALLQSIKLYPTGRPLHFLLEEFPTLRIPNFDREMLVLRGLGGTAELYSQEREVPSEDPSNRSGKTIYNQCDIKSYFAIDNLEDAKEVSEILGSSNEKNYDANFSDRFDEVRFGLSDTDVPLMSPQALMAMPRDEQIIKIRGMRPIRAKKLAYWEIAGLRELLDDNPLEGPAPETKAKAEIKITADGIEVVSPKVPRRFAGESRKGKSRWWSLNPVWLAWLVPWLGLYFGSDVVMAGLGWPALRTHYSYVGSSNSPHYTSCRYFALNGDRFYKPGGHCPLVMLKHGGRQWR